MLREANLPFVAPHGSYFIVAYIGDVPTSRYMRGGADASAEPRDWQFCRWLTEFGGVW